MGNLLSYLPLWHKQQPKPLLILDMNKLLVFRAFMPTLNAEQPQCLPHVSSAKQLGKHLTWWGDPTPPLSTPI